MKYTFLYLTSFSRTGGIEKFNKAFMKALSELRPGSRMVSVYDRNPDADYVQQHAFKGFNGKKISAIRYVLKQLFKNNLLIVGHVNLAPVALLMQKLNPKLKVILIAHGIEIWEEVSKKKRKMIRRADKVLAVSNYTKNKIIEIYGVTSDKIEVFHNTLDPFFKAAESSEKPDYLMQRYNISAANKVLITVCRLSAQEGYKGYDQVLEALPGIIEKVPNLKYIIVGKYDQSEKARLDEIIQKKELTDHVIFTGFVKDEELYDHFQLGDAFIMPSRHEGFGIVFIEAMALGIPVIAGNKDGSVDALDNGNLGLLVDPDDEKAITNAAVEVLSNPRYGSKDYKMQLIQKVNRKFGFENYKKRLQRILEELKN